MYYSTVFFVHLWKNIQDVSINTETRLTVKGNFDTLSVRIFGENKF